MVDGLIMMTCKHLGGGRRKNDQGMEKEPAAVHAEPEPGRASESKVFIEGEQAAVAHVPGTVCWYGCT